MNTTPWTLRDTWPSLLAAAWVTCAHTLFASSGLPWESPIASVADSITGTAGAGLATIGIAWTGINWGRGTDHGKEAFITTAVSSSLIFGAAKMVQIFGGNAGGVAVLPPGGMAWEPWLSTLVGELLGQSCYLFWLFGGIVGPLVTWFRSPSPLALHETLYRGTVIEQDDGRLVWSVTEEACHD